MMSIGLFTSACNVLQMNNFGTIVNFFFKILTLDTSCFEHRAPVRFFSSLKDLQRNLIKSSGHLGTKTSTTIYYLIGNLEAIKEKYIYTRLA